MGKLFTPHDPFNLHKTLGVVAALHTALRLCFIGKNDMNFDGSLLTLGCMAWHTALSCSSLIFRLPKKRSMVKGAAGSMIWPEYRLHSILFALRSMLCMAIVWGEQRTGKHIHTGLNWLLVAATLLAASKISESFPSGTNVMGTGGTIRDLEAPAWLKTMFSNMQFHLSAICLVGVSRFSLNFFSVWIIQFTAFLMTLRRKNLAPHRVIVYMYAAMLFSGFCTTTYDLIHESCFFLCHILGNCAFLLRLGVGWSKYAVWATVSLIYIVLTLLLTNFEAQASTAPYNSRIGWVAEDLLLPLLNWLPTAVRSLLVTSSVHARAACALAANSLTQSPSVVVAVERGQTGLMALLFAVSTAAKVRAGRRLTAERAKRGPSRKSD